MTDAKQRREPPLDLFRRGDAHHVVVELPGVSADQVRLHIAGRDVTLSADATDARVEADDVMVSERPHGPFERRFQLPEDADPSTVTADCTDGLLHLAAAQVKPDHAVSVGERDVEVSTGGQRLAPADESRQQ